MKLLHETSIRTCEAVLTILLTVTSVKGEGGCRDLEFLDCQKNRTLSGHVIKSFRILAPGLEDCQHRCFIEDKCVSYNLSPIEGMARSCELNDADHWMWAHHVIQKEDFEYCPIKNRCSPRPCPSNKICVPDFSWDSFSCVDGVWTQWTSWTACHLPDCPRTRTRNCTNPTAPQNIGTDCRGAAVESDDKTCDLPAVDITGCEYPLGMENRTILDSQINASSFWQRNHLCAPNAGRLNNKDTSNNIRGVWAAAVKAVGEYMQVDLGSVKMVTKIATQGRSNNKQWVTEYRVSHSNDKSDWTNYRGDCVKKFPGNSDGNTVVTNKFEIPILARYFRVIVQEWHGHPSLRMELYGCTPP